MHNPGEKKVRKNFMLQKFSPPLGRSSPHPCPPKHNGLAMLIYTLPQPGGPQKIIEGISLASSKVLKRLLFPNT